MTPPSQDSDLNIYSGLGSPMTPQDLNLNHCHGLLTSLISSCLALDFKVECSSFNCAFGPTCRPCPWSWPGPELEGRWSWPPASGPGLDICLLDCLGLGLGFDLDLLSTSSLGSWHSSWSPPSSRTV